MTLRDGQLALASVISLTLGCVTGPQVHGRGGLGGGVAPVTRGVANPMNLRPSATTPGGSFDETLASLLGGVHTTVLDETLGSGTSLRPADELWIIARGETTPAPRAKRRTAGHMYARPSKRGRRAGLVLTKTAVSASIVGNAATVDVRQRYRNPRHETIEAVYSFPLPHDAAVSDFVMTVGTRRIRGIVRDRKQATILYRQARKAGYVASLLTLDRPNVFEHKVANIEPGKRIDVHLRYHHVLPYDGGAYSFVFPRGGSRMSMQVDIEAGVPIASVRSPSHDIAKQRITASRWKIRSVSSARSAGRDFVLRYGVAGQTTKAGYIGRSTSRGGYFTLVLHPPVASARMARAPLEMIFLVDCSPSMRGTPLRKAKRVVARALTRLTPADTFQIVRFSSHGSQLGDRMIRATPANVGRARRYLRRMHAEPRARMVDGIRAALSLPHDATRFRFVSFVTDGYLGNHGEVLRLVDRLRGAARIFGLGIGGSVNRYLLEQLAKAGRGAVAFVGLRDASTSAPIDEFYRLISRPALTDVALDFGSARVREVFPRRIPDLFTGRPVTVTGRVIGRLPSTVMVRGRLGGRSVALKVPIATSSLRALPTLRRTWARAKAGDLADRAARSARPRSLEREIERLAIRHGILTSMTSLVTVDAASISRDRTWRRVLVPTYMPETAPYMLPTRTSD